MKYIGLDVHKTTTTACFIAKNGKPVNTMEVPSTDEGYQRIWEYLDGEEACFMMESSTYIYRCFRFFSPRARTYVAHANSLKMITDTDKKTDKKDAESIGRYLRLYMKGDIELSIAFMPSEEQCALKDLCRYKEELSSELGDMSRRIKSHMHRNLEDLPEEYSNLLTNKSRAFIRRTYPNDKVLMARLDQYELNLELNHLSKAQVENQPYDNNVKLLESIPGIGRQTAIQMMSMIIDPNRFENSEKFRAYFGMVPRVRDSGGSEHHGHRTKAGDPMMRFIIERVTSIHVHTCNSSITKYYNAKKKEIGVKKAMVNSSSKMMTMILAILKRGTPFKS